MGLKSTICPWCVLLLLLSLIHQPLLRHSLGLPLSLPWYLCQALSRPLLLIPRSMTRDIFSCLGPDPFDFGRAFVSDGCFMNLTGDPPGSTHWVFLLTVKPHLWFTLPKLNSNIISSSWFLLSLSPSCSPPSCPPCHHLILFPFYVVSPFLPPNPFQTAVF